MLADFDIVPAQGSVTMQRKRKWAPTTALQFTGKTDKLGLLLTVQFHKLPMERQEFCKNLRDALNESGIFILSEDQIFFFQCQV